MGKRKKVVRFFVLSLVSLVLSACSLPGLPNQNTKGTISIGSTSTTESRILAGIVKEMVEYYTDVKVSMISNLGSSRIMHQAVLRGDVMISASRYTGSDLTGSLGLPAESDPVIALELVQKGFAEEFQLKWYPSYGFENTYAFMVSEETAARYQLVTISDLASYSDELRVGIDNVWLKREGDGYKGFTETYGITFANIYSMQIGLVYDAIEAGKMDVALGYSTDGRIASYGLVTLVDDLQFFPAYDCSIVASNVILAEYPELDRIFAKLEGKIDTATMQRLNYEADDNLIEPELVARRFLQENRYFMTAEDDGY